MESRSVSVAWKIMMVPVFAVLLFGLIFTFVPDVMLSDGFEGFTGESWSTFVSANPTTTDWIELTAGRMFGTHILVMTVLFFVVTFYGFRKGQSWSWYALLISTTLVCVPDGIATFLMGLIPIAIANMVFLMVAYVALGISAKDILSKK